MVEVRIEDTSERWLLAGNGGRREPSRCYYLIRLVAEGGGGCSVAKPCLTLGGPMDCSTPGLPVPPYFLKFAQAHVQWVGDAVQPSHSLLPFLLWPSISPSIRVYTWVYELRKNSSSWRLKINAFYCTYVIPQFLTIIYIWRKAYSQFKAIQINLGTQCIHKLWTAYCPSGLWRTLQSYS